MGFTSSLADPDLWYKPETKRDGSEYYSYILVYVDNVLIIDEDPKQFMEMIQASVTIKPESIDGPKTYLGADLSKVYYNDGSFSWTMGSYSYIEKAVKNLKARLEKDGLEFNKKLSDPLYRPAQEFSNVKYRP